MTQPAAALNRGHEVVIDHVSKVYRGSNKTALDDVSLHIAAGEFMTFLGPSGSGKTTLLSMIAGFTSITQGGIEIDGRDVSRLKPHKRNLGVVFQQYALFPHMDVARNIAYSLEQRGMRKAEIADKVDAVMDMVGLTEFRDRLPAQLSGGQQQRVALARAVVYEPNALLMDEPLGALDKKLRDKLQREIARMHRDLGMTFIFVTHDQHEALALSDRIAVFSDGKIEQVGTATELYESPETLFVAEFLGESNCFTGLADAGQTTVVRPENMKLENAAATTPTGALRRRDGLVTDQVYAGDHVVVGVRLDDGKDITVKCGTGEAFRVSAGDRVRVTWNPQDEARVPAPDTGQSAAAHRAPSQTPAPEALLEAK